MIAKSLNRIMKTKNISNLSDLAETTGLSKSVLHGYLNGSCPSIQNLIKLANIFNVSVDYLLDIKERELVLFECNLEEINLKHIRLKIESY
jgi:transcriptional regulator with XRE-family HTH domain